MGDRSLENGLDPGDHPVNLKEAKRIEKKPSDIHYSKFTIEDKLGIDSPFACKHMKERPLLEVFKALLNGTVSPDDLGLIKVVEYNYGFYVYDGNKRLFVYRKLEQENIIKKIPVLLVPLDDEHFRTRLRVRRYGFTITCRSDMRIEQKMSSALSWWICNQTVLYVFLFVVIVFLLFSLIHYTMDN